MQEYNLKKPIEKMTIDELRHNIEVEEQEVWRLEIQDERNFSDFEKSVRGRDVNMPLCRNHISYYENRIKELQKNTLANFCDETISRPTERQIAYCRKLCIDIGFAYEYADKRIRMLTRKECSILVAKLLKGACMNDVFEFWENTSSEALAKGAEILAEVTGQETLKGGN